MSIALTKEQTRRLCEHDAKAVRDGVNSYEGRDRLRIKGMYEHEDGSVSILMNDTDAPKERMELHIGWEEPLNRAQIEGVVDMIVNGSAPMENADGS